MTEMTRAQMETLLSLQEIELQKLEVQKILDAVAAKVDEMIDRVLAELKYLGVEPEKKI